MKHIVTIIGARPQFVKAAVVSRAIKNQGGLRETIIHTGQHYDNNMSSVFFKELKVPAPKINLEVGSGSHGVQTGEMMRRLDPVLAKYKPDIVLVYGDTNSTLAGSLCAAKLQVPVGHVEAGLRSFNRRMPEELNRIVADHMASLCFCPTEVAAVNLKKEGIASSRIRLVGDVMYDAALQFASLKPSKKSSRLLETLPERFVLVTIHRAENVDAPRILTQLIQGLVEIGKTNHIVFPLHPRTHAKLSAADNLLIREAKINLIEPIGYIEMQRLIQKSSLVCTDSGGLCKEAFFHGKPCLILRNETEWTELLRAKAAILAGGAEPQSLAKLALHFQVSYNRTSRNLYGTGSAAKMVAQILTEV